jgi:Ca2+-binding RTX toxin-like protein
MPTYTAAADEFTIAGVSMLPETQPRITHLANGGFVAVWTRVTTASDNQAGDVVGQLFDAQGNAVGTSFYLTIGQGPGLESLPFVDALAHGGFVASWRGGFQIFTDAGQRVGDVHSDSGRVVANPNGGFDIYRSGSGFRAQSYDDSGNAIGSAFTIPQPDPQHFASEGSFARLNGGGFAVAISYTDPTTTNPEMPIAIPYLELRTYSAAGTLLTTQNWGAWTYAPDLAALPGGGFVLIWSNNGNVEAQLFDAAGAKTGPEIHVSPLFPGYQNSPSVTALAAGGFVITWQNRNDQDGLDIKAQAFDAAGNKTGGEFVVNSATNFRESQPDVTELANGDLVFTWSRPASQPDERLDVEGRLFRRDGPGGGPINGTGADDVLHGTSQGETINGLAGNDVLYGHGGQDVLNGGEGNDYLVSAVVGGGPATLNGGAGNDSMVVQPGDIIGEAPGGGYDNVAAAGSFVLNAGAEVEVLSTTDNGGTAAINLTGNELANVLVGNAGANVLDGGPGGADILQGLGGDDIYFVDADDRVYEDAGGGYDYVVARSSFALGAGSAVEIVSTSNNGGTSSISLTGNELANVLVGNAGANALDGGFGGADILVGLGGNDTYFVDADDRVFEDAGGGSDYVVARSSFVLGAGSAVELVSTSNNGGAAAIDLIGNELGQVLVGNAGANILDGGNGNDLLVGLGGADTFRFAAMLGASNVDTINDFVAGTDRIALDDTVFAAIGAPGALNPNAFFAGAAAHDADDRIVYNSATGRLFYDADGNGAGAQVLFATLTGAPVIAASDFTVI